jgi:hypothetical protein
MARERPKAETEGEFRERRRHEIGIAWAMHALYEEDHVRTPQDQPRDGREGGA